MGVEDGGVDPIGHDPYPLLPGVVVLRGVHELGHGPGDAVVHGDDAGGPADGEGLDGPYTIDVEKVIAAQPDYIFIESGNLDLVKEDYANSPAVYNALSAVENGNTYTLISHRFYSTNVELALANCYQVASVLFPGQFEDVDPVEKLDEICRFLLDSDACSFFKDGRKVSEDLAETGLEYKQVDVKAL